MKYWMLNYQKDDRQALPATSRARASDLKTRLLKRGHGSDYSWELLPPLRGGWAKTH